MTDDLPEIPSESIEYPLVVSALVEGGTALVAIFLGWLISFPPLQLIDWNWLDFLWGIAASTPLAVIVIGSLHFSIGPLPRLADAVEPIVQMLFRSANLIDLAAISILAGVGEELLFRGIAQISVGEWLGGSTGRWIGLAVGSILFGLAHAVTRLYAVLAGLIGLYLGWLWILSGNLLVPIAAHAAYDFVALAYLARKAGGKFEEAT